MMEKRPKYTKKNSFRSRNCLSSREDRGKALLDSDHEESDYYPREKIRCLSIHHQDSPMLGERSNWNRYRPWKQERNYRSARLEKQLKVLEERIDKQLKRFQAQYSRASNHTLPKDVANLLMPKSAPPLELATLSWLGDWRPSSILGLLNSLLKSPTLASSSTHAGAIKKAISHLIHDLRIEEAVMDEAMAEIQANWILNLPFAVPNENRNGSTLDQVNSEIKKVHHLIVKAQNFRINVLETVVKKVLCQSDAAEFLVALGGIQETVHQFSRDYKMRKGPVCIALSSDSEVVGVTVANQ